MKTLFLFDTTLDEANRTKIINFFLQTFYASSPDVDIELDHIIEERTTLLILSLIKPTMQNGEIVQLKQSKAIKILLNLHKNNIQSLIKGKKIILDSKNYMKYYKQFSKEEKESDLKSKLLSKLGLVLLVFYLKSEIDFQQEIEDIIEIKKFDKEWSKMFTDLTLNIMHKGNVMLSEFAMGIYKKMSKHIGKEGVDILIQFLKDTKPKKEKNQMLLSDDEDAMTDK